MQLREAIRLFLRVRILEVRPETARNTAYELRKLCLYLGDRDVASITLEDILGYIRYLKRRGLKPNTLISPSAFLRKFFRFLAVHGYTRLSASLIPLSKPELKPARVATEAEYRQLLAAIPDPGRLRDSRNRCLINLLWDSGARLGEILSLDIPQMDLGRMRAVIPTEKSRGRRPFREIFWTRETNEQVRQWLDGRGRKKLVLDSGALFICIAGHNSGKRLGRSGTCEILRKLSVKAGLPTVNAHSFRHHMGHYIIQQGGSTVDVMNILGHSSLERSAIYTMMTDRELEERYRKFRAGFGSGAGGVSPDSGTL